MNQAANPPAKSDDSGAGCGCLIGLLLIVTAPIAVYSGLKETGYIPHTKTVDMYMSGDWLVGENRSCVGYQSNSSGGPPELTALDCPVESYTERPHNVEVKFYGKTSRPDHFSPQGTSEFEWRCKREESGFTCYALN
jgi:hypothetical protein